MLLCTVKPSFTCRGDRESMMVAASGADQEMKVQLIHNEEKDTPDSPYIPWQHPLATTRNSEQSLPHSNTQTVVVHWLVIFSFPLDTWTDVHRKRDEYDHTQNMETWAISLYCINSHPRCSVKETVDKMDTKLFMNLSVLFFVTVASGPIKICWIVNVEYFIPSFLFIGFQCG